MTKTAKLVGLITISMAFLCCRLAAVAQSDQEKIEGAKKEGPVYWYGSMNVDDASALVAGIEGRNKKALVNSTGDISPVLMRGEISADGQSATSVLVMS